MNLDLIASDVHTYATVCRRREPDETMLARRRA